MSSQLIALSPDLKRLRDEGYNIQVVGVYLVVRDIPYLAGAGNLRRDGILACALPATMGRVPPPANHTAYFIGSYPCHADGSHMTEIVNSENRTPIAEGLAANFYLSASPKPSGAYKNFYDKVSTYVRILRSAARTVDGDATAKTFAIVRPDNTSSVFKYEDTASSRAGLFEVNSKLQLDRIAILGLGGTGGYILDLVAKTGVCEIHLFDKDRFLQHNAFRAPGAADEAVIVEQPYKVDYFASVYGRMRNGVIPHREFISAENVHLLDDMRFVFITMEDGPAKRVVIARLLQAKIPFVEAGMGVYLRNNMLGGILRTVAGTPAKSDHIAERVPFSSGEVKNDYDKNIQIVELNALHAAFAVIKWKKLVGFYADQGDEHYSAYTIGRNHINNGEIA